MKIDRNNYPSLAAPVGPYVHAVKYMNTLYISGVTAFGTRVQSDNIQNQAREVFNQIDKIAKSEDSSLENIIKVTIFVTDLSNMDVLRKTLFNIYGDSLPASSLIHVAGLFSEDLKIEVEAIIAV
jgi:2-iminobutanoate/2-iminopropanoate deaminase